MVYHAMVISALVLQMQASVTMVTTFAMAALSWLPTTAFNRDESLIEVLYQWQCLLRYISTLLALKVVLK